MRPLRDPRFQRLCRLALGLLMAVVSWLAFRPADAPDLVLHADKLRHLAAFGALAAVAALGWPPGRWQQAAIALGLLAYGLAIELIQSQLPTRSASAADWLADAVGVGCGLLLARTLRRRY
ncbi:MAG: VanZ family protein [Rubrivivax sp.]|nr:VanZ family protein [Rubrivivax sp.]